MLAITLQIAQTEDWIEPCNGYQVYVAAGGGDSAPALALQRVCALVGARRISQACLVYYTRKTADYPVYSAADLAADKVACSASMPGELSGELASDQANDHAGVQGNDALDQGASADMSAPDAGQAFAAAERIMDAAFEGDVSQWGAAAARALPLYQAAAAKGLAEAWLALGDLHEMGLGTAQDNAVAVAGFARAGALGLNEGHERALYLLEQIGDDAGFVAQFLTCFRAAL